MVDGAKAWRAVSVREAAEREQATQETLRAPEPRVRTGHRAWPTNVEPSWGPALLAAAAGRRAAPPVSQATAGDFRVSGPVDRDVAAQLNPHRPREPPRRSALGVLTDGRR
jgi:hypothetical protein